MGSQTSIHVKVTPEEKADIEAAARALSLPLSIYVRMVALREARKGAAQ